MPDRSRKRRRDLNALVKSIVDDATNVSSLEEMADALVEMVGPDKARKLIESADQPIPDWLVQQMREAHVEGMPPVEDFLQGHDEMARLIRELPVPEKDPAAVALGRKGGLKGGKARAAKLTPEERSESARKAADARWKPRD
jgi:hypothetical protein